MVFCFRFILNGTCSVLFFGLRLPLRGLFLRDPPPRNGSSHHPLFLPYYGEHCAPAPSVYHLGNSCISPERGKMPVESLTEPSENVMQANLMMAQTCSGSGRIHMAGKSHICRKYTYHTERDNADRVPLHQPQHSMFGKPDIPPCILF